MSASVKIDVDDVEVDMAIAKLKLAVSLQGQLTGVTGTRRDPRAQVREWDSLMKTWSMWVESERQLGALEKFAKMDLPTVNREMRVLLGQVPGARQAIQYYFRLRRLQRAAELATGATPAFGPLWITILATAVILLTQVQRSHKQWERRVREDRREYEDMFREGLDITHAEWEALAIEQRGFATWGEQFTVMREEMGTMQAIVASIYNWWLWYRDAATAQIEPSATYEWRAWEELE